MRQSYRHLGREAIEMVRLSRMTPAEIVALTEIPDDDLAAVRAALAEGKGLLFTTGHYGNWEVAAAAVAARGMPIDAIVKRQRNPLVDAQVAAARRRMGVEVMEMSVAPSRILRALSQGHAIGIVGDQDARSAGAFVPFFGIPSSTYRGPAMMALRFGTPLFSAVARRLPDGRYQVSAERIPVEPTGDQEADVVRVTASLAASLEREIRKDPGQYFWFHKRWKTAPAREL
jgi:KDO2-lipid IV(A) lauroyltransferase